MAPKLHGDTPENSKLIFYLLNRVVRKKNSMYNNKQRKSFQLDSEVMGGVRGRG